MEKVLVTGGAGFIGSNFIHYLMRVRPDVFVFNLDALTYAGNLNNLVDLPNPDHYQFIHGDICDERLVEQIFAENSIDTVIHFAAESHVDRSIKDPIRFMNTNVMGTTILLNAALKKWLPAIKSGNHVHRFHHISTDEVFGSLNPDEAPFSELTPYSPNSPYAASKAASDLIVRSYFQTYHLPISITNCSNNYGPYQFPEKLIPLMIQNAIHGLPLPIYGDGRQIRDWLFVEDHCEAILRVLEKGLEGESYNIGGNNQPCNLEIIKILCSILDEYLPASPFKPHYQLVQYVPDRPGHDRRYAMNANKMKSELGWQPRETIESGLRKTVAWYLANDEWLKDVMQKPDFQAWITHNYSNRKDTIKGVSK
jgi:dTDP-glucose 4,6-dehydratase